MATSFSIDAAEISTTVYINILLTITDLKKIKIRCVCLPRLHLPLIDSVLHWALPSAVV